MVIGDDHLEPARLRAGDLLDGGDPAVDRQDEPDALVRQSLERLARDAVALLEPARQMPADVRAELTQDEHGERGRADAVDVVVAVDADPLPALDRGADPLDGGRPFRREERVVTRKLRVEERPRASGSSYPRRASTAAVISLTPSSRRERPAPHRQGAIVQEPVT